MKNPYISLHKLKQKTQSSLATFGLGTRHTIGYTFHNQECKIKITCTKIKRVYRKHHCI